MLLQQRGRGNHSARRCMESPDWNSKDMVMSIRTVRTLYGTVFAARSWGATVVPSSPTLAPGLPSPREAPRNQPPTLRYREGRQKPNL